MVTMNKQGIKLAREILDLPDTLTDEEIADELRGSSIEKRIEFRLAWDGFKQALPSSVAIFSLVALCFLLCFFIAVFIIAMKVIFNVGYFTYILTPVLLLGWYLYRDGRLTGDDDEAN